MPQLNLFYFPQVAFGLLFFYLIGYFFFFKWVLGQLMFLVKVKNYFSRDRLTRPNPLAFLGVYELTYGETLLFVIEFSLLLFLLSKVVDLVLPDTFDFNCSLRCLVNPYQTKKVNLVRSLSNVYILLSHFQGDYFYRLACATVVSSTLSVLNSLNFTFQRLAWVENLFQVFIPTLQRTCRQIGPE